LIFFTASIKRDASDIKKPRQQAGLDVTLKKQELNNRSGVGSQELRQTDKKRDSFGCLFLHMVRMGFSRRSARHARSF
ncbi:MAG: hypothetical protein ACRDC0_02835, partial [Aeromonas veronii]